MRKPIISVMTSLVLVACQFPLSTSDSTMVSEQELRNSSLMQVTSINTGMLETLDSFVRYQVGNPNFEGRTTVEVQGDAQVTVTFERGNQKERYTGTLSIEALAQFRDTLNANSPQSLQSSRATGTAGEARIQFTGRSPDGEWKTELWSNEQWSNTSLRSLVVAFNDIAKKISDGLVKY